MTRRVGLPAMCPPALCVLTALLLSSGARAGDPPTLSLTLKDHHFSPSQLIVPTGQRFRIQLDNQDASNSEFESYDMKFEKIVVGGGRITVWAGPLHPGSYKFFDDYNPDLAVGTAVAPAQTAGQ